MTAPSLAGGQQAAPRDRATGRLLLVEDNPTNREVALAMLKRMGLHVEVAEHGGVALEMLARQHYDLVLMDLHMPVLDGLETTRAIRATDRGRTLPVIAMTAAAFARDREAARAAGMNDYLGKPIDPRALADTLRRWLPSRAETADPDRRDRPADSAPTPPMPTLDGFDLPGTLQRIGGGQSLLTRVLRRFERDFADWDVQLDAAWRAGDGAGAARLAHTLKGAAGNIGAVRLQAAAAALETALAGDDAAADPNPRTACVDALRQARSALRDYLAARPADAAAPPPEPTTVADPEDRRRILDVLETRLRGHRQVPDALLARLRSALADADSIACHDALLEHLGRFDFNQALATLGHLRAGLDP